MVRIQFQCCLLFISLLTLGVAANAAHAADTPPNLHELAQRIDNRYDHLHSLQADFAETYTGSGMDRRESGTLWLKKPGKMLWEYRSPREKLFVSDGKTAWFYVPDEHQVQKTPVKKLDDLRSPFALLLGKTKLEKELQGLSWAPDVHPVQPGDIMLRGVPKGLENQISEILLEATPDGRIERVIMVQADGAVTEYQFSNQKENVAVQDSKFKFSPPAGSEVVESGLGQ